MITPIYFPFTYVPQWVAETLAAVFKQFCAYQPSGKDLPVEMQAWVDKNALKLCVPVTADIESFAEVVKEFQRFARLHADGKDLRTAAFCNRQGTVPFFNDTSASQIIADLKKDQTLDAERKAPEALLRARIFLEFAQEFDRQNAALQQDLDDADRRSGDLLKHLSGQNDNDSPVNPLTAEIKVDDPGEYMARVRLQAWIRLFLEKPIDSGFLVTSSPSIFYYLVDNLPSVEKFLEFEIPPANAVNDDTVIAWRDIFLEQIKNLIVSGKLTDEGTFTHRPPPETQTAKFKLMLYWLPGCHPAQILARFLTPPNRAENKFNQMLEIRNTLLGLIEPIRAAI